MGEDSEILIFRDIDILEQDEDDYPYQGCMAVVCGDKNMARNILFEDIRIESIQEGMIFNIREHFNPKYDKAPGRGIDGITFRNITYQGIGENKSVIFGYDNDRKVRNVFSDN